jgi:hypothetical protein
MVSLSARGRVVSASAKSRCAVALPPRGPKSVAPRSVLVRIRHVVPAEFFSAAMLTARLAIETRPALAVTLADLPTSRAFAGIAISNRLPALMTASLLGCKPSPRGTVRSDCGSACTGRSDLRELGVRKLLTQAVDRVPATAEPATEPSTFRLSRLASCAPTQEPLPII